MSTQQIASVARQALAIAAIVLGALTATLNSIHLPTGASAALTAIGGVILAVEHFVADPSTGTPTSVSITARIEQLEKSLGIGTPTSQLVPTPPPVATPVAAKAAPTQAELDQAAKDAVDQANAAVTAANAARAQQPTPAA